MLRKNSDALPVQTVQHMVLSVSARAKRVAQSTRRTRRLTRGGQSGNAKDYFCERTRERDRLNLTLDERLSAAIDMSVTEALRTQLDALQTEFNKTQPENIKLKEENPDGAAVLELEGELSETQAENVRLAQQLGEAQERATELEAAQAKQAAAVDEATTGMRAKIDDLRQRLADRSEQFADTTEALYGEPRGG